MEFPYPNEPEDGPFEELLVVDEGARRIAIGAGIEIGEESWKTGIPSRVGAETGYPAKEEEEEESIKPGKVQELNTGVREAPRCAARYIIVPGTQLNHMNELKALCPT
ncbi:hypothetical protein K435DRAFT_845459 [Dendrothele bispora CBS 962.96]|uniref:Uncharacterized protein n=1 Tax=Dendrothele bispora (strain CBS 962.96) TaxID=1314807 RepID=A0A4S8KUM2_DENBC|nr:hypothetical protein K435DRAFT_845459 [Dendrothele bispora CBS 962.96]